MGKMKLYISIPDGMNKEKMLSDELRSRLAEFYIIDENHSEAQLDYDKLKEKFNGYDAILTSWGHKCIRGEDLDNSRVKFIGHIGGTVRTVVNSGVFDRNICVVSANEVFASLIAEGVLYSMLTGIKRWHESDLAMKRKSMKWGEGAFFASSLFGKSIGLIGYGNIARELIRLLTPFNAKIFVSDPYVTEKDAQNGGFTLCSDDEICRNCDIISLHHTLTEQTYHMIDERRLQMMRDNAVLINTARGAVIDENALASELAKGRLYAVLDVYEHEPLSMDSQLRSLENVFITPHLGAYSDACYHSLAASVVEQALMFASGKEPHGRITKLQYSRMTNEALSPATKKGMSH